MWRTLTSNERDDWIIATIIFLVRTIFWWYIYLVCSGAHEQDDYLFISSHSFLFRNKMLKYNSFSSLFGNLGGKRNWEKIREKRMTTQEGTDSRMIRKCFDLTFDLSFHSLSFSIFTFSFLFLQPTLHQNVVFFCQHVFLS